LDRPCGDRSRVGGYRHEARVCTSEVEGGVELTSARISERRLSCGMVLRHELELDRISHLGRDLIGIEDGI